MAIATNTIAVGWSMITSFPVNAHRSSDSMQTSDGCTRKVGIFMEPEGKGQSSTEVTSGLPGIHQQAWRFLRICKINTKQSTHQNYEGVLTINCREPSFRVNVIRPAVRRLEQ